MWWTVLWGRVRTVPGWAWGALAGASALAAGLLRLKRAEARALEAENASTEARLERDGAVAAAHVEVARTEDTKLEAERAAIREDADDDVTTIRHMADEDVNAWVAHDAEERRGKREPHP